MTSTSRDPQAFQNTARAQASSVLVDFLLLLLLLVLVVLTPRLKSGPQERRGNYGASRDTICAGAARSKKADREHERRMVEMAAGDVGV